jgi:hypothetical protein
MFVASSQSMNVIQHLENGDNHLYFIIGGTMKEIFLYFIKITDKLDGNFITYNTYTSEIGVSEKLMREPNLNSIPIIEIVKQDLLSEELLKKVESL